MHRHGSRPAAARTVASTLRARGRPGACICSSTTSSRAELVVGAGTAVFVSGWCFSPQARIRSLSFVLDGDAQPVGRSAHAAARSVPSAASGARSVRHRAACRTTPNPNRDPRLLSYRSGLLGDRRDPVARTAAHGWELSLRAELDDGHGDDGAARDACGQADALAPERGSAERRCRAAGGDRDGDVRPAGRPVRATGRVDPRPDPPQLDLRDQRRLLTARRARHDPRATIDGDPRFVLSRSSRRLGLLPQLRARARARAADGASSSPSPTRTIAGTPTSSPRCWRDRRRHARLQRRAGRLPRRASVDLRDVVESAAKQPLRPAVAARRQRGHRRCVAVPPRSARRRAAVSARAVRALSRSLDRARGARAGRHRVRPAPALRLRPARRARRSGTRPPTG